MPKLPLFSDFAKSVWDVLPQLIEPSFIPKVEVVDGGYIVFGILSDIQGARVEFRFSYLATKTVFSGYKWWPSIDNQEEIIYRSGAFIGDYIQLGVDDDFRELIRQRSANFIRRAANEHCKATTKEQPAQ